MNRDMFKMHLVQPWGGEDGVQPLFSALLM